MKYDSVHDAGLYLTGTVVKYQGKAAYVAEILNNMTAEVYVGQNGRMTMIPVNELDLTPIKLGYVINQKSGNAIYVERKPARQWRQGISTGVCGIRSPKAGDYLDLNIGGSTVNKLVAGRYPTIFKALRVAKKKRKEIPFSKNMAIDRYSIIRYKTLVVGNLIGKRITMHPNFSYLDDVAQEYMNEYFRHI